MTTKDVPLRPESTEEGKPLSTRRGEPLPEISFGDGFTGGLARPACSIVVRMAYNVFFCIFCCMTLDQNFLEKACTCGIGLFLL